MRYEFPASQEVYIWKSDNLMTSDYHFSVSWPGDQSRFEVASLTLSSPALQILRARVTQGAADPYCTLANVDRHF